MNVKKLNQIEIEKVLSNLGHFPARISGDAVWYYNPFFQENNCSFKVSRAKNCWYLFSEGVGGNTVDLLVKYFQISVSEVLKWADQQGFTSFHQQNLIAERKTYEITEVSELQNWNLKRYLMQRGLSSKVYPYVQEVKFTVNQKNLYAVGFQNCSHGWELRNSFYKGSLLRKDISLIRNLGKEVLVFEGFIDALSYIEIQQVVKSDLLVLNSVALVDKAIKELRKYASVVLLLDNDDSGKKAKEYIQGRFPKAVDGSMLYRDYKDLNEFIKQR